MIWSGIDKMGMFDTILQEIKCPKCNKTSEMDLQTKDGPKSLNVYKLGDKFTPNWERLESKDKIFGKQDVYNINLLGVCNKCSCFISGCARVSRKTHIIEEIELWEYSVHLKNHIGVKMK
jgi:hypothetical protein